MPKYLITKSKKKVKFRDLNLVNKTFNPAWKKALINIDKFKNFQEDIVKIKVNSKNINTSKKNTPCVLNNKIFNFSSEFKDFLHYEYINYLLKKTLPNQCSIIDLGAGWGYRSFINGKYPYYGAEYNKLAKKVIQKISKNSKHKKIKYVFFDAYDYKTIESFKKIKKPFLISTTFFEQITLIDQDFFIKFKKILNKKKIHFCFIEPVIFKTNDIISKFNLNYCKQNLYNSNLLNCLNKAKAKYKIQKNVFCYSFSPKNLKKGTNVLSIISGYF